MAAAAGRRAAGVEARGTEFGLRSGCGGTLFGGAFPDAAGPARPGRAGYGADMRRRRAAIAGALWRTYGMGPPDGVLRKVRRGDALDVIPGLDRSLFPAP